MRYAKSLRFGVFVDSKTAKYTHYSELRLVCPCCKEPVYLVQGFTRQEHARIAPKSKKLILVKGTEVSSFFCHFGEVVDERCENYNRKISEKHIKQFASISRKQRLEYWQKSFLKAIGYYAAECKGSFFKVCKLANQHLDIKNHQIVELQKQVSKDFMEFFERYENSQLLSMSRRELEAIKEQENPLDLFDIVDLKDVKLREEFEVWAKTFVIDFQLSLIEEVYLFLKGKAAIALREQILDLIFARVAVTIGIPKIIPLLKIMPSEQKNKAQEKYFKLRSLLVSELVILISLTDWSRQ